MNRGRSDLGGRGQSLGQNFALLFFVSPSTTTTTTTSTSLEMLKALTRHVETTTQSQKSEKNEPSFFLGNNSNEV